MKGLVGHTCIQGVTGKRRAALSRFRYVDQARQTIVARLPALTQKQENLAHRRGSLLNSVAAPVGLEPTTS